MTFIKVQVTRTHPDSDPMFPSNFNGMSLHCRPCCEVALDHVLTKRDYDVYIDRWRHEGVQPEPLQH